MLNLDFIPADQTGKQNQVVSPEQKRETYSKEADVFYKNDTIAKTEMDYFVMKNDLPAFQSSLIKQLKNDIASFEHYNEAIKAGVFDDGNMNKEAAIRDNERRIASLSERVNMAQERPDNLAEYTSRSKFANSNESVAGLSSSTLAMRYINEVKNLNSKDLEYFPQGDKTHYPHKFDKLIGLAGVAKTQNDQEAIEAIKKYSTHMKFPEELLKILE